MPQVRALAGTFTTILTSTCVGADASNSSQCFVEDRMYCRHTRNHCKKVRFGRTPVEARNVIICNCGVSTRVKSVRGPLTRRICCLRELHKRPESKTAHHGDDETNTEHRHDLKLLLRGHIELCQHWQRQSQDRQIKKDLDAASCKPDFLVLATIAFSTFRSTHRVARQRRRSPPSHPSNHPKKTGLVYTGRPWRTRWRYRSRLLQSVVSIRPYATEVRP